MAYIVGFAILAIIVWVMFLRGAGTASGEAIGSEFNSAAEKIGVTLRELVQEVSKGEPERLSVQQFNQLVERAADDFSRYIKITYVVSSKLNQGAGRATTPLPDFLATSTSEFASAIGTSIAQRNPSSLLQVMDKYGIKNVPR
jgi:hypothetical protein